MKKNILIIDDSPDDLAFYCELLTNSSQDYTVYTTDNAEEAIEIFSNQRIYCTFIDYALPEMNGLKILEVMNQKTEGKVLPVVILTGEPNQTIQAEAARKGALDYVIKDVANTPEQIETVIQKTVSWADDLNRKQLSIT